MIPLILAIVVLSVSILISQKWFLMKEWYLWACIVIETYMRGKSESLKIDVLQRAGKRRFPVTNNMLPKRIFRRIIQSVERDLKENYYSMKNYRKLVQGIVLYDKDYTFLLRLIEDVGKREKA